MYDAVVVGLGGIGSATLCELATRGLKVLGLDQFGPAHDRGSSHGATRVIRKAYFEHPDYVPLLQETYRLWFEFQRRIGSTLFENIGLLEIGPPDGAVVAGVRESAERYGLNVRNLTTAQVNRQFPGMLVPAGCEAVFEEEAGLLHVERAVTAFLDTASTAGAERVHHAEVTGWRAKADSIVVQTTTETYSCRRLVIAAGAWADRVATQLGVPLRVVRKHLHWVPGTRFTVANGYPTFLYQLPDGVYYGFPGIDDRGIKVGEHSGGSTVSDPSSDDREPEVTDLHRVESFLQRCMPEVVFRPVEHSVCFYTMSPDEHFVLDHVEGDPRIAIAAGLSGHGYKFAPVFAKVLADLVIEGGTDKPVEFLRADRFGNH